MILPSALLIYDLGDVEAEEQEVAATGEVLRLHEPTLTVTLEEDKTYDSVIGVKFDETDLNASWIFLSSETYKKVQMLHLRDFIAH